MKRRPSRSKPRPDPTADARGARGVLGPALALFGLTAIVFLPTLFGAFLNWDDDRSISANRYYNPPTASGLAHYWTGYVPREQLYVPVVHTAWWLAAHQGGLPLSPVPFHLLNLLSHCANAALAFLILRRLVAPVVPPGPRATRVASGAAAVGAAAFALHPLQVEAVAWASTLYTTLSATFALLAVWLFMRFTDAAAAAPTRQAWRSYAGATACFALALLTKPTVVALPLLVLAIEVGLRGRKWRDVALPLAGWVVAAVPAVVLAKLAQPMTTPYWPLWRRPLLAADGLAFYVYKFAAPVRLIPDYGRSPRWLEQAGTWHWTWIVPAAMAAAAAWVFWRRRDAWPLVALVALVVSPLPMLGLTPFDYQRYSTVADRYLYLGLLGPALLAAYLLARRPRPAIAWAASAAVLVVWAGLSHRQTYRWHDTRSLFGYTMTVNPDSMAANSVLGFLAASEGNDDQALRMYQRALAASPDDANVLYLIGNVHLRRGRFAEAVGAYEQAVRSWPDDARVHSNLGVALFQSGRPADAVAALERAVSLDPRSADAHLNMAIVLMGTEDYRGARRHYEQVLRLNPTSAAAQRGLARLSSIGQ